MIIVVFGFLTFYSIFDFLAGEDSSSSFSDEPSPFISVINVWWLVSPSRLVVVLLFRDDFSMLSQIASATLVEVLEGLSFFSLVGEFGFSSLG